MNRWGAVSVAALIAAVVLPGCTPATYSTGVLSNPPNSYNVTADNDAGVTVSTSAAHDQRIVGWKDGTPETLNGESCATWQSESTAAVQQGVALRIRSDGVRTDAVTVTKNVMYGATWILNFHAWPNESTNGYPFASVDLEPLLRGRPLPWHVCARATAALLEVKVWLPGEPDPGYGDSSHGGSAVIPLEGMHPGMAGWYAAHIPADGSLTYTGLSTS